MDQPAQTAEGENSAKSDSFQSFSHLADAPLLRMIGPMAIAMLADIELRERSGGTESLDTVLGKLQACCLPATRQWSGTRLFERLDSFLDTPVFMPLYREYANKDGFPDVSQAFDSLGVVAHAEGVTLMDDAPLATIRKAID